MDACGHQSRDINRYAVALGTVAQDAEQAGFTFIGHAECKPGVAAHQHAGSKVVEHGHGQVPRDRGQLLTVYLDFATRQRGNGVHARNARSGSLRGR